jgi:hypothetical protein
MVHRQVLREAGKNVLAFPNVPINRFVVTDERTNHGVADRTYHLSTQRRNPRTSRKSASDRRCSSQAVQAFSRSGV